ncbi:hypothetical protein V6N00_07895 [Tersicoccus sp. MR15.9]|uniref:hypothetical protein n=1 Tax=Tersicoccus mangrovi TaxID=3121635 RepID=UPI002FE64C0D
MHQETPTRLPMSTVISHIAVPIVMGLVMALAYFGGFHKPEPHDVPVAIVGQAQQVGPVAAQVQLALGDKVAVTTVPDAATAQDQLRHQKIAGAFVPDAARPTLMTASAASATTTDVVTKIFTAVAAKQGHPLTVQDVVPLGEGDPMGQNGFFYLVTLSVGAYATAIAIGAAGSTRRFRERLGLILGSTVVLSTAELAVATILFDMFPGHGAQVWGLSALYTATVMAVGVGLHALVGRFSTLLFSAMFVAVNFTSSGGVVQPALQPGFFGWLHDFWIGSGFLQVMAHLMYFPDTDVSGAFAILIGWLLFGIGALAVSHAVLRRRKRLSVLVARHDELRRALHRQRTDGLSEQQARELELEEDVAV